MFGDTFFWNTNVGNSGIGNDHRSVPLKVLLMEKILHQLIWYSKYPIIYRVLYIPGGAGFLPSTISFLPIKQTVIGPVPSPFTIFTIFMAGVGSRSARLSLVLSIGLVFCLLSPLVSWQMNGKNSRRLMLFQAVESWNRKRVKKIMLEPY